MNCAGLVLAAGGSRRLGQPKQLLSYQGSTLVENITGQLLDASCDRVFIVLGASGDVVAETLRCNVKFRGSVDLVRNDDWQSGQSGSLRCGLDAVARSGHAGSLAVALCDQPLVPTGHYAELIASIATVGRSVAATAYPDGRVGVPACLNATAWNDLIAFMNSLEHRSDVGAKHWIDEQPESAVLAIACDFAAWDIDKLSDLDRLRS